MQQQGSNPGVGRCKRIKHDGPSPFVDMKPTQRNVLVTGGSGYLGSFLVRKRLMGWEKKLLLHFCGKYATAFIIQVLSSNPFLPGD